MTIDIIHGLTSNDLCKNYLQEKSCLTFILIASDQHNLPAALHPMHYSYQASFGFSASRHTLLLPDSDTH